MNKFLLCGICKLENQYLGEWISYHLSIGFDKIVLIDNNDTEGEFAENIYDVPEVNDERVEIYPLNNGKYLQQIYYQKVYEKHRHDYDWFCFLDIDEFFTLTDTKSVKEFVQLPQFEGYNTIKLCWLCYGDSGLVKVENDNYSVLERFTEVSNESDSHIIKTMFKTFGDEDLYFPSSHGQLTVSTLACNTNGERILTPQMTRINKNLITLKHAYIRHYRTKTIEEYLNGKIKRGGSAQAQADINNKYGLDYFFRYNKLTHEKKQIVIDKLGIDALNANISYNILFINIDGSMNDNIIKLLNYKNVNVAHNIKYDILSGNFTPYNTRDVFLPIKNYEVIVCSIDHDDPKHQEYMAKIDERFKNNSSIVYFSISNNEIIKENIK